VADTFIAGQMKAALDVAGGLDQAFGGDRLHNYRVQGAGYKIAFSAQRSGPA
jgi:hypothetical protein